MFKNGIKKMDITVINQSLRLSIENKATFPEHVKTVSEAGVIRYLVDLSLGLVTYYDVNNDTHQIKLSHTFEANETPFSREKTVQAILDIQGGKINYLGFLDKIYQAGIRSYEVDIQGKQVVYSSSKGENHIEFFPSKPKNDQ